MKSTMVCLIGEQPVSNLLPIRHFQPEKVFLVHSEQTERVSKNLEKLIKDKCSVSTGSIDAFDLIKAKEQLAKYLKDKEDLLFNITGGTKPMALAGFFLAKECERPIVYLQSEGGKSLLYCYEFEGDEIVQCDYLEIGEVLTIDDYLKVHGLIYKLKRDREPFEELVGECLRSELSEVYIAVGFNAFEIDLILRHKNQVGIAEVKTGRKAEKKEGIDQLSTASQREFLGTYTARFLILDRTLPPENRALALAHNIKIIELLDDKSTGLSERDKNYLIDTVKKTLGYKRNLLKYEQ